MLVVLHHMGTPSSATSTQNESTMRERRRASAGFSGGACGAGAASWALAGPSGVAIVRAVRGDNGIVREAWGPFTLGSR